MAEEQPVQDVTQTLARFAEHVQLQSQRCISAGEQLARAAELIKETLSKNPPPMRMGFNQEAFVAGLVAITEGTVFPPSLEALGKIGGIKLAMQITGKTRGTIYNMVARGKLPAFKNGGQLQFSEEALKAFAFKPRNAAPFPEMIYPKGPPGGFIVDQLAEKLAIVNNAQDKNAAGTTE